MKHFLFTALGILLLVAGRAQSNYWQQQTDYKIEVSLNDSLHELNGFITISYKNNSPDTLRYLLFHLWPNAYRNHNTPFAEQMLENGNTKFHFSKPWQRGYMDKLDFKVDAEVCTWALDGENMEKATINLNEPLLPGNSITISSPFHVRLPQTFSRLGHEGQSYQICQWYPKPAVYDKHGWNWMPYLDQGEFYSEYGSFDVSITLPANYVVGATGDLQNPEELQWLDSLDKKTRAIETYSSEMIFPASAPKTKTLHYIQSNIHDFAWFADKRFHVLKGEVELPYSKRKVTTWAMFTNNIPEAWCKADTFLHDAIYYYSKWIGEYPYNQVTGVEGALQAGGGMEYPNVTIIGDVSNSFELDDVLTHEVGHNWFYGLLGSNERQHPWMDEGINSYYEYRYLKTKYPNEGLLHRFPKPIAKIFDIAQYKHSIIPYLAYLLMARENLDQALEQPATAYTDANYALMVYMKSAAIFNYLEAYLGTEVFDRAMKAYFSAWVYKHPEPDDLRKILEQEWGQKLDWFFYDLIYTTNKIDYKAIKNKKGVVLKNIGRINAPLPVACMQKDSTIYTTWLPGFDGKQTFAPENCTNTRVMIDPNEVMPDINRKNNTPGLRKVRFQFIGSLENQKRTQIFFAPYLGWNNYDKTQVGLAFYNSFLPTQKFNYLLVPAIGTGSKNFVGFGNLNYNFFPDNGLQRFTVGIKGKRFSYLLFPKNLLIQKVEPYVQIEFKKKNPRNPDTHTLEMRSVIAWLDWINFSKQKATQRYYVNEFKYRYEHNTTLNPLNVTLTMQQGDKFMNLQAEARFLISYKRKGEGFHIRVYAGGFPVYFKSPSDITAPNPKVYLSTVTNNTFAYWLQKDYMFDENFIDRNGRDKYVGRQVALTGGAFRSLTTFGSTSKFLTAVNLWSPIHRFFPIYPFLNAAVIVNDLKKVEVAAEFGLSLAIIRDMVEIHLPLLTTKNIKNNQEINGIDKLYKKFTFTLKLQLPRPMNLLRQITNR